MQQQQARFVYGVLLLTLAIVVSVIGLVDLSMYLLHGSASTLSEAIADAAGMGPGAVGTLTFTHGASFVLGMLATHFTRFRM